MLVWLDTAPGGVRIEWDSKAAEHLFIEERRDLVSSYPTMLFIKKRLQLAEKMQGVVGVALWELGQMMTMFIDLL
jgi:hypothetical protein